MKKGGDAMLDQIMKSLEEVNDILDEAYKKNDAQKFNSAKKLILQIQNEISRVI
ncbi:MAG: hypothetical protein WD876_00420 [Candidatus Pacearchaeota archaeon]